MKKKKKMDECTCSFGAEIIEKHRQAVAAEIDGVIQSDDIEYIHRMRVATRRLRSAIPLFQSCFSKNQAADWLKQSRAVTRALGEARDLDVQIEKLDQAIAAVKTVQFRPGMRRLRLRLTQKRLSIHNHVIEAMRQLQESRLLPRIETTLAPYLATPTSQPPSLPLYQLAAQAITQRLDIFLACEASIFDPKNIHELHQMRIEAKRLRYTLEIFATLYPGECKSELKAIKSVQELLGDIHDCDVWTEFLPEFITQETYRALEYHGHTRAMNILRPGLQHFLQLQQQTRAELYQRFLVEWQSLQQENVWPQLRQIVSAPLEVYPNESATDAPREQPCE